MDDESAGQSTPEGAPEAASTSADAEREAEAGVELRGTEPEPGLLAEEEAGVIAPSRMQEPEAWKPRLVPWAPRDPGGANLGRLETVAWDEAAARLIARDAAGATLLIQPLGPATLRVTLLAPGADAPPTSFAVLPEALTAPPALPTPPAGESGPLVEAAEGWTVATAAGPLTLGHEGNLRWARADGEVIQVTGPGPGDKLGFGWGAEWTWVWLVRNQGAAYLGFGERTGALDRSGLQMTFWTADVGPHHPGTDAMYQCLPVGVVWDPDTGHTTGIFSDYPGLQRWDLGQTEAGAICVAANAPLLDLYLFAGPTMPDVLAQYTALTGRMPLPPRWALGFQQSRWSYFPQSQVLDVAREFRRRNLPADVIYLDIDYMRGFRDFTFDPRGFPDPAALTAAAADLGFRIVTILDPGVKRDRGYPVYDEMFRRQYYVKWPDGRPYVGKVWPGPCVFPDFFQQAVRDWWGSLHARLLDVGIAGIWDDMNEPAVTNEQPGRGRRARRLLGRGHHAAGRDPRDDLRDTAASRGAQRLRPADGPRHGRGPRPAAPRRAPLRADPVGLCRGAALRRRVDRR